MMMFFASTLVHMLISPGAPAFLFDPWLLRLHLLLNSFSKYKAFSDSDGGGGVEDLLSCMKWKALGG